ncbi:MAG TPA: glutamine-hydrolyzing carbamoyl-phosphate synthase small subunit [Actinomycetota bacterium]|nr:glutamine-hydrolyzing carbamoyl-phosphate synthase small subunit [Actinomycetota bacterium]
MRRGIATLALEDGTVFTGRAFGAHTTVTGEVCFNTGMTGYQEVLTDPSYHGQIVTMTSPQIGNTGVNSDDDQSVRPWVAGFVVREESATHSSWRSEGSLHDYLDTRGVPGISDIDTRRLTRHIRTKGAMRGALSAENTDPDELVDIARSSPEMVGRDLAREVTTDRIYHWGPDELAERATSTYAAGAESSASTASLMAALEVHPGIKVAALDLGLKRNILDLLVASGCEVDVMPATTSAAELLSGGYQGVFLSNGPGDPEPVDYAIETVRGVLGRVPVFGICLGHQILGLALGAKTYKLPFGHRGANHPVGRAGSDQVEITCQNHGFAVDAGSLKATDAVLTHTNLNDGTVEGLSVPGMAFSVQYHPESGPGPHDSRYLFEQFQQLIGSFDGALEART